MDNFLSKFLPPPLSAPRLLMSDSKLKHYPVHNRSGILYKTPVLNYNLLSKTEPQVFLKS